MISLIHGRPQFGDGYVRRLPVAYLPSKVRINLKENIRISLNFLISHYILENNIDRAFMLCEFLTKFDKSHYDHFWKFGQINKIMGRKNEAIIAFKEAINICKADKNWNNLKKPEDPAIEEIISLIESELKKLQSE